jgi:hypothetical protein
MNITQQPAPSDSFLRTHLGGRNPERWGQYDDCFSVRVDRPVGLEEFVFAFYTTWVFRLERCILRLAIGAASTDAQARGVGTLQFGSAVASAPGRGAARTIGNGLGLLLGFHVFYSRVLLRAAAKRLLRSPQIKPG